MFAHVPLGVHLKLGLHRSPKVLNVLEFDFSVRIPLNVLEFHWMFLNFLETDFYQHSSILVTSCEIGLLTFFRIFLVKIVKSQFRKPTCRQLQICGK